jgi:hypothetical protein
MVSVLVTKKPCRCHQSQVSPKPVLFSIANLSARQYTSMPFFEAGTERFVRDWRTAVIRVVVRDSRVREVSQLFVIL